MSSDPSRLDAFLGLTIVAVSILLFAVPRGDIQKLDCESLRHTVIAGLLLALALLFDVKGIRAVGGSFADLTQYAVASSLVTATGIIIVALVERTNVILTLVRNRARCYPGAILLLTSYVCGMWAYAQGPISLVAPVRSSVLFSGVLAVVVLRKQVTKMQWTAMFLALVGVMLIQVG